MARLPNLERDQLSPADQKFYDAIADSRGSVRGPYGVLLHSPDLAARVAHTGTYVRYNLDLPEALRETIILATAREIKSQYEFFAHARLARQAGEVGGTLPAVLNAANEVAVDCFCQQRIRFDQIAETVGRVMDSHAVVGEPSLEEILAADGWARGEALRVPV